MTTEAVAQARALLESSGYVVVTEKSYRAAQERQRIAKVMQESAERYEGGMREWLERDVFPWERHLVERVNHLAGLASRLGATAEDFVGPPCLCGRGKCGMKAGEQRG
jgi:hypothetical protein